MTFRKVEKSFKTAQRWTSKWVKPTKGLKRGDVISKKTTKGK